MIKLQDCRFSTDAQTFGATWRVLQLYCCTDLRYPELLATPVVPTQASTASLLCNTGPRPKMLEHCRL